LPHVHSAILYEVLDKRCEWPIWHSPRA